MARRFEANAAPSRARLWVIALLAASIIVGALLIWSRAKGQPHPTLRDSTGMAGHQPIAPRLNDVSPPPSTEPTSTVEVLTSAATQSAPPMISSNEVALQARISELESEVAALEAQLTNSATNGSVVPIVGIWTCASTDSCGALTRQVSVSGSGTGRTIHVVETDRCQTMDWGEAPFNDMGTPNPGQDAPSYPCGFAMFSGQPGQGGFQQPHRLFLIVTFEAQGISTIWSRLIMCGNCAPSWFTNFMTPAP